MYSKDYAVYFEILTSTKVISKLVFFFKMAVEDKICISTNSEHQRKEFINLKVTYGPNHLLPLSMFGYKQSQNIFRL